jgi:hypothetical protein
MEITMGKRGADLRLMTRGLVLVAAVTLLGCHLISEDAPTDPSPVATVAPISIPVILPATPTPQPTPTPTPNPGPQPTPTPDPTPTPAPPPSSGGCNLPPSDPPNPVCTDDPAQLLDYVESAITNVTQKHPELFDFNDKKCDNCYFVKDIDTYVSQVVKELGKMGLCALWDGEEIALKESNSYSEQYDIILSSGHIRRGPGCYRGVCRPSWF